MPYWTRQEENLPFHKQMTKGLAVAGLIVPELPAVEEWPEFEPFRRWRDLADEARAAVGEVEETARDLDALRKEQHENEVVAVIEGGNTDAKIAKQIEKADAKLQEQRADASVKADAANRLRAEALECFRGGHMRRLAEEFHASAETAAEEYRALLVRADELAAEVARCTAGERWASNPTKGSGKEVRIQQVGSRKSEVRVLKNAVAVSHLLELLSSVGDRTSTTWLWNGRDWPSRRVFNMPVGTRRANVGSGRAATLSSDVLKG